ncbi:MaoC family dehydratase N-terminal domain-containing protein [Alicyclobacillus tolerans]|uniref:MaoC/PaaZ C-terminal domain-containing protein n=1 Tax=Alicyclobacillus tolerans TaxID=90970 RepID=UPI001F256957|nr:MaoC/PaaZ C-terminal domain-containing protein [Alicyclobacillus tolerans]MCF8565746.1 MaoC family dehydratase N-terminal domain-containing protein [Alicyclobacillus tolerans]
MGLYFEDFHVGDEFKSPGRTITESDVVAFAGISGDFDSIHMDAEYARQSPFGQRIVHGLLGLSIIIGLVARTGILEDTVIAFLGVEWDFVKPIFIGDTVHVFTTIENVRPTRKPDRGIIFRRTQLISQHGEVVQEGLIKTMVKTRTSLVD